VITPLIERAAQRTTLADAMLKTDETTALSFAAGRLARAETRRTHGVNLRVVAEGRLGFAGSTADDVSELVEAALASARVGDLASLALPRPAPLPPVITHAHRAAAATVSDLVALGELVRDRLAGDTADLALVVERSLGSVRVANTRGLDAGYDVSQVAIVVEAARTRGGRRLVLREWLSGADLPSLPDIERLVSRLQQRLQWAARDAEPATGRQMVGLLPSALPLLLTPVEQALLGKAVLQGISPLGRRRGTKVFSELFTLRDDPTVAGRPGSRPVDDEGVPSRPVTLVQAGQVEAFLYDLETATRVGASPTGHGRRTTFAKPQPAASNLVVEPGTASLEELLAAVGDGLLIEEFRGSPVGNPVGGTFAQPASVAWGVRGGEVLGIAPEVTVAGNAHDLLGRIVAVGRDPVWLGSRSTPTLVVEGVSVF
jgi:PmbA protein